MSTGKADHTLGHKASLATYRKVEVIFFGLDLICNKTGNEQHKKLWTRQSPGTQ